MKKFNYLFLCLFSFLALMTFLFLPSSQKEFDFETFSKLPALDQGRLKPLGTVARTYLLQTQTKQKYPLAKEKKHAQIEWLLDHITQNEKVLSAPNIVVEHPQIFAVLDPKYYKAKQYVSFQFLETHKKHFIASASEADRLESAERNKFQKAVVALRNRWFTIHQLHQSFQLLKDFQNYESQSNSFFELNHLGPKLMKEKEDDPKLKELLLYFKTFKNMDEMSLFAPILGSNQEWTSFPDAHLQTLIPNPKIEKQILHYAKILDAYANNQSKIFNEEVAALYTFYQNEDVLQRSALEAAFNRANLFYVAMILFGLGLIAVCLSIIFPKRLYQIATALCFDIALLIFSFALLLRMIIEARPPVTNLYSSAIFVGWAAVGMGILFEKIYRNKMGYILASISGILSLIVAHHLSLSGDSIEMMRAVLDSNFWLSTHVITITLGYSAVFAAGFLAVLYILIGFLSPFLNLKLAKQLVQATYISLCIAILLSTVGTVLGAIWADQSWGRFWGWDPKENGAILIMLWLAIVLHARLAGLVKDRGLMVLSVFGNVVCAASWFGVNMLGIGLHSYGFMDKSFIWLMLFWLIQIMIMLMGSFPLKMWASRHHLIKPPKK